MKTALKEGLNLIEVHFESPISYSSRMFDEQVIQIAQHSPARAQVSERHVVPPACVPDLYHGVCHANHIRKMQVRASPPASSMPGLLQLGLGTGLPLLRHMAAYQVTKVLLTDNILQAFPH